MHGSLAHDFTRFAGVDTNCFDLILSETKPLIVEGWLYMLYPNKPESNVMNALVRTSESTVKYRLLTQMIYQEPHQQTRYLDQSQQTHL